MIDALAAQIDRCETYRAVAGKVLFSGGSGPVLTSHSLASRLFSRGVRWGNDIPSAADWLIRLMTTHETTGFFKAAIWGLEVGAEVSLSKTTRLMPFSALPGSYMRGRLIERARRCYDGSTWMTQNFFDVPSTAYVEQVDRFPYIRSDNASFLKMDELVWRVHEFSIVTQAASVGQPLAVAAWFDMQIATSNFLNGKTRSHGSSRKLKVRASVPAKSRKGRSQNNRQNLSSR